MRTFLICLLPLVLGACRGIAGVDDKTRNTSEGGTCDDTPVLCGPKVYDSSEISGPVIKLLVADDRLIWSEFGEKTATNRIAATKKSLSDPTIESLIWITGAIAADLRLQAEDVWWVESAPPDQTGGVHIGHVGKDGSNAYTFPQTFPQLLALELDQNAVYFSGWDGNKSFIQKLSSADQTATSLYEVTGQSAIRSLAIDDSYLYFADYIANTVGRISLGTGTSDIIDTGSVGPMSLVRSGDDLFWSDQASVYRKSKDDVVSAMAKLVYPAENAPAFLAADADNVYFAEETPADIAYSDKGKGPDGIIGKLSRAQPGGNAVTLATLEQAPRAIALDENAIYVGTIGQIVRIPK